MRTKETQLSSSDEIWREAAEEFRLQLQLRYGDINDHILPEAIEIKVGQEIKGILIDRGNPRSPALLLQEDGSLRNIQFGISPEPGDSDLITGVDYCILATEIINNRSEKKM